MIPGAPVSNKMPAVKTLISIF